jgi:hypothetical protein
MAAPLKGLRLMMIGRVMSDGCHPDTTRSLTVRSFLGNYGTIHFHGRQIGKGTQVPLGEKYTDLVKY